MLSLYVAVSIAQAAFLALTYVTKELTISRAIFLCTYFHMIVVFANCIRTKNYKRWYLLWTAVGLVLSVIFLVCEAVTGEFSFYALQFPTSFVFKFLMHLLSLKEEKECIGGGKALESGSGLSVELRSTSV